MNKPLYFSYPGVICSSGIGRNSLWNTVTNASQDGIQKISVLQNEFFAARIGDLEKAENARFDMRIIRIENAALKQIDSVIKKAILFYGKERIGICIGSCDNGSEFSVAGHREFFSNGVFSDTYQLEMQSADYVSTYIKELYDIQGPALAFSTACSSSASAIAKASQMIKSELVDAVIVGGVDIASDTVLLGFNSLEAVSSEKVNPFSKNRHGITLGDGAAFFVLSKDNFVEDGSAVMLAGYGESSDAYHMTSPSPDGDGAVLAMMNALCSAGITAQDIDYLNLHGTGTVFNDSMESKAVSKVFGDYKVPCSSTKSQTGHTLGAAGALEAAVCYETIVRNYNCDKTVLPVQCWDGERDESLPFLNIVDKNFEVTDKREINYCMSNSFAFGGSNVSLILATEDFVPQQIEKKDLEEYLPHRGKMILLSRITAHDVKQKTITSEYDITSDCVFYDDRIKGVPSWAGFEMMAQGISALSAISRKIHRDIDKARAGVVLSVSNFKSSKAVIKNNTTVQMKIKEDFCSDDVYQYDCSLYENVDAKDPVVTAKITVMEMKNMKEKLCQKKSS